MPINLKQSGQPEKAQLPSCPEQATASSEIRKQDCGHTGMANHTLNISS
ncbi:hypothetical protein [Maridesulfovibrio sp.]